MFYGEIFSIFVDGNNIISDTSIFFDIDVDDLDKKHIQINKININRYYQYGLNVIDKLSDNIIMCYDFEEAEKCVKIMNQLNNKTEKLNAKIRCTKL